MGRDTLGATLCNRLNSLLMLGLSRMKHENTSPQDRKKSFPRNGNPGLLANTKDRKLGCIGVFLDPNFRPSDNGRIPSANNAFNNITTSKGALSTSSKMIHLPSIAALTSNESFHTINPSSSSGVTDNELTVESR